MEKSHGSRHFIGAGVVAALLWIGLFLLAALPASAVTPGSLPSKLRDIRQSRVHADVEVTLPMAADGRDLINYDIIALTGPSMSSDTIMPLNYLLEWSLPSAFGQSSGFTSYFNGNLFRYRDSRLREYHFDDNPAPFLTADGGVQRGTQFLEIIPFFLADELEAILADSTYTCDWREGITVDGVSSSVLKAVREINGDVVAEYTYTFGDSDLMPSKIVKEMSPGAIGEQTVTVKYIVPDTDIEARVLPVNEDELIALYPDIFDRFREKTYRLTSLPGQPVPDIALQTLSGSRYTHPRGEKFLAPVVIAFLDETVSSTPDAVKAVREAVGSMPFAAEIIWIFLSNDDGGINSLLDNANVPGEVVLKGGRKVLRQFGVTETPSFIIANPAGEVADVIVGYNKDLASDVIQKVAVAR